MWKQKHRADTQRHTASKEQSQNLNVCVRLTNSTQLPPERFISKGKLYKFKNTIITQMLLPPQAHLRHRLAPSDQTPERTSLRRSWAASSRIT